jgi:hypothetical protein
MNAILCKRQPEHKSRWPGTDNNNWGLLHTWWLLVLQNQGILQGKSSQFGMVDVCGMTEEQQKISFGGLCISNFVAFDNLEPVIIIKSILSHSRYISRTNN